MKKLFCLLMIIVGQVVANGCTVNNANAVISDLRSLDKFSGIKLMNSANVYLTQGDVQQVRIETADKILPHIITKNINNVLVINTDKTFDLNEAVSIFITVKDLNMIEVTGSGNVKITDQFKTDDIVFRISGSGNIDAALDSKSLKIILSGAGNIEASGKVNETTLLISGSGDFNGKELSIYKCNISITGSGTCTVDVKDDLTASITGSGNIFYISIPERMLAKSFSSGRIEKVKA